MTAFFLLPTWLFAVELLTRLALIARAIMRPRPINATLAWVCILLFVPVISQIVYLLVGENRLGSRRIRRYDRLTKNLEQEAVALWRNRCLASDTPDADFSHIARYSTAVSGIPPLKGNRLDLLPDNLSVLAAMVKDIDAAVDHVHMLYYIWAPDEGIKPVIEALARAAARGVQVRVLADGVGSAKFLKSDMRRRLEDAGAKVVEALPASVLRMPLERLDLRNHRKICVVDGKVGYCGSQNMHTVAFHHRVWRRPRQWIDSTVRVQGPGAQALAVTFLRDWQLDSDEDITDIRQFLPDVPEEDGGCVVQVVPSGPGPTPLAIHQALLTLIYTAREELIMTTPYFVPDEAMFEALLAAAARGVDVTLVVPLITDAPLVAAAARAHYLTLLEAGVKILQFEGGLLHAKAVTMDRRIGLIGSTNFDQRSFFLNFEITMFVYDDNFASMLRFMQVGYMQQSRQIYLADWRRRSLWCRARDNCAQLLGPLL
jgi:cardiolipin synthase